MVTLFNKKEAHKNELVVQKYVIVHFSNYIYQMCLPFGEKDKGLEGKVASFPFYPLLVDESYFKKYSTYKEYYIDFSSNEKKIGEVHEMSFSFKERITGEQK